MSDQLERHHGKRGAKLLSTVTPDPVYAAIIPAVDTLPATGDTTKGRNLWPMLMNDSLGDCAEVGLAVAMMNQATTGLNDRQQPVYTDGFVEPTNDVVSGWYHDVATLEGEPFTTGEGPGTSLYTLAKYALQKGLVVAVGVLGTVQTEVIAQAIFDTNGGAIVTWALDDDCFQEFDADQCWGTMSVVPDEQEGHATDGLGWGPGFTPIVDTWTKLQCTTPAFVAGCQDGLMLVLTQPWVDQGGDLDAVVAKWGLTTVPTSSRDEGVDEDESLLRRVEDAIDRVPNHVKEALKHAHKLEEAIAENVSVDVLETIVKDLLRTYTHGVV